jgi:hypothetical protein
VADEPPFAPYCALVMQNRLRIAASRARVVYLLLALSLLIGQSAAQAHVYSHFKSTPDFAGTAGQLCSECLSSAPLLAAAGCPASPFVAFIAVVATPVATPAPTRVEAARHYAFRSRAPPDSF